MRIFLSYKKIIKVFNCEVFRSRTGSGIPILSDEFLEKLRLFYIDTIADFDLDLKGKEKEISDFYFNWIEDELIKISADKVPYIIIAGHYPIYSVSTHGPTYLLIEKLRPLLVKYKVNAYFSGESIYFRNIFLCLNNIYKFSRS